MVVATDFDGTIVTHMYPEIGEPIPGAFPVLKALKKAGHKIFLWTMRGYPAYGGRDTLTEAVDFCRERGLEFDGVNESPIPPFSTSKKQYAHIYIDDAACCAPVAKEGYLDWQKILVDLTSKSFFTRQEVSELITSEEWFLGR